MGLLNRLFGGKKNLAKEISLDEEKIQQVWADYLATYETKANLAKNKLNVEEMTPEVMQALQQIESLIAKELVYIEDEQKAEKEVLRDLDSLTEGESADKIEDLTNDVTMSNRLSEYKVQALLEQLFSVLQTELQIIQLIKRDPSHAKDTAIKLRDLIKYTENVIQDGLNSSYTNEKRQKQILDAVHKVLAGNLTNPPKASSKVPAIKSVVKQFAEDLLETNFAGQGSLEKVVENEALLTKLIAEYHPKFSPAQIKTVIKAFREAYYNAEF